MRAHRRNPERVDRPQDLAERRPPGVRDRDVSELAEIAVFTDDVPGVSAFYRSLVESAPVAEWRGGALFSVGDAKILVHERAAGVTDGPPNEDHFALSVA